MFKKYIGLFILTFSLTSLTGQVRLSLSGLEDSFSEHYQNTILDTIRVEYDFISKKDFKRILSNSLVKDIDNILSLIETPIHVDSLMKIRTIKCYYSTHSYSIWYVILTTRDNKNYYYMYENNSGVKKVPLIGHNEGKDYIWELANKIGENCSQKNKDYMVLAEIQDDSFNVLKATQTFHIADDDYFKIVMNLIKKSCE